MKTCCRDSWSLTTSETSSVAVCVHVFMCLQPSFTLELAAYVHQSVSQTVSQFFCLSVCLSVCGSAFSTETAGH